MKTSEIQAELCKSEVLKHNIPCENVSWLLIWEADILSINKSGYLTEFEVKVSRSDFKADAKKRKWSWFEMKIETQLPNYFYYACPVGLIGIDEVPKFAGLVYVGPDGVEVIKKASLLHKQKRDRLKVIDKFCRILTERLFLGKCRLTYENDKIRNRPDTRPHL